MFPVFVIAALAYGASTFGFGVAGAGPERRLPVAPRWILAGAALVHLVCIGVMCIDGNHPFRSIFLAVGLGAWLAAVGYLAVSARDRPMHALGAVLSTFGLVGLTVSVVAAGAGSGSAVPLGPVLGAHIALATLGLASFCLAAGVAGLYLAMDRRLRGKTFLPHQAGGGMSLHGLERLHWTLVLIGMPIFTLAVITGAFALVQVDGSAVLVRRGIEIAAAAVAFASSLAVLVSRIAWGLRGRRAAWLTIVAFLAMVLIVISYGVRS
jgi:ABC-type uncharacterized transport system permease subunit